MNDGYNAKFCFDKLCFYRIVLNLPLDKYKQIISGRGGGGG